MTPIFAVMQHATILPSDNIKNFYIIFYEEKNLGARNSGNKSLYKYNEDRGLVPRMIEDEG